MNNANNVAGYTDYFRQLAISHKDVKHDPLSETGNATVKGTRRFGRTSASEVLSALPSDAGTIFVTVELYDTNLRSDNPFDIKGLYKGAFMIVKFADTNDFTAQEQAHADCERIGYEFLQKIWVDHYGPDAEASRSQTPFRDIEYNEADLAFVSGLFNGTWFGWRCEFGFNFNQKQKIAVVPADGTFL